MVLSCGGIGLIETLNGQEAILSTIHYVLNYKYILISLQTSILSEHVQVSSLLIK